MKRRFLRRENAKPKLTINELFLLLLLQVLKLNVYMTCMSLKSARPCLAAAALVLRSLFPEKRSRAVRILEIAADPHSML